MNFRKFKEANFKLHPQMNVFIGKNGSGKTAILEAANIILGAYLAAFKTYVPSKHVANISKYDAHLLPFQSLSPEEDEYEILTAGGVPQYPCGVACSLYWDNCNYPIWFQRILKKPEGRTMFGGSNPMQETVENWEFNISKADHSDREYIFPIALYLSSARLWNESRSKDTRPRGYNRTDAFHKCLDAKHSMELAFEYIQRLQLIAVEERRMEHFPAYETILNAINIALRDELAPGEEVIFSTRYSNDIVALRTAEGTIVPFTSLSDGYRNVIKIILDIATRMCILNPYLGGNALRKTPGIVIIDEIDLSLHPMWQKRIVGILKELFPKVQFLCASHSPFIIQSLEDGELFNLDKIGQISQDEYSGESIEDIAEDFMGVELPQYSEKKRRMYHTAQQYYQALESCHSSEELNVLQEELTRLEAEYSKNPAYLALIRQKYTMKQLEVNYNETNP